jgi:hypothetical protein
LTGDGKDAQHLYRPIRNGKDAQHLYRPIRNDKDAENVTASVFEVKKRELAASSLSAEADNCCHCASANILIAL